jgi:hypothetical protein
MLPEGEHAGNVQNLHIVGTGWRHFGEKKNKKIITYNMMNNAIRMEPKMGLWRAVTGTMSTLMLSQLYKRLNSSGRKKYSSISISYWVYNMNYCRCSTEAEGWEKI